MATITRNDESLVERDEVLYPSTDLIDTEPLYNNFTAIQNALRHRDERAQTNTSTHYRSHSSDNLYRSFEPLPSSSRHYYSNDMLNRNTEMASKSFPIPINIQSKQIDGHVFNLTRIVENIGYDRNTPFIRSSPDPNTKNVSALLNIILKMGGAHGPLVNVWRSRINDDYFQRWYLEKHDQRSASMIQYNSMNHRNEKTTQQNVRDHRSNLVIDNSVSTRLPIKQIDHEKRYQNDIKQIYGYEDIDTMSSISSHSSSNELESINKQRSPSLTSILKKKNNSNNNSPQTKHQVTIREPYPPNELNRSSSFNEKNEHNNNKQIISDYQQFIRNHPHLNNDPNPEIITKPNPDQITYQQNVSIRYLVPPTPPPPGPLIIREIISPRAPSPPPLIVQYQEPSPPTPPPLILREAPPPPPPQQETTVLTRVLPPESQSSRRVIVEHSAPLPPKPQPIIIEKWLPYKPAPPREVIYERVTEEPVITEFEPNAINIDRQRRYSTEFNSQSSRVQIPVNNQRRNSVDYFENEYIMEQPTRTFDQLAWSTHQQILAMQQRGREQVQAHQQWAAAQWQQHANMFLQYPTQLTTPSLVVYQPPVTMNTLSYVQRQEVRQEQVHYNNGFVYPFY